MRYVVDAEQAVQVPCEDSQTSEMPMSCPDKQPHNESDSGTTQQPPQCQKRKSLRDAVNPADRSWYSPKSWFLPVS